MLEPVIVGSAKASPVNEIVLLIASVEAKVIVPFWAPVIAEDFILT